MKKDDREKLKHFARIIDKDIKSYATNVALKTSKYIFISGKRDSQRGYCTHCKKEYPALGAEFKHNEETECPKCLSTCIVKHSRYGRKHLKDWASFTTFKKSKISNDVLLGIYCFALRDYSEDFKKVKTEITIYAKYSFKIKDASMYECNSWSRKWKKNSGIFDYFFNHEHRRDYFVDNDRLKLEVQGTAFKPIVDCFIQKDDMYTISKLALFCKYPNIEYAIKAGCYKLIDKYVKGYRTYRRIYWAGKKMHKFLRMTQESYNKIKGMELEIDHLVIIHEFEMRGYKWTRKQLELICEGFTYTTDGAIKLLNLLTVDKITNYIVKQMAYKEWRSYGHCEAPRYDNTYQLMRDWTDYIDQCEKLNYDLTSQQVLRPKDLHDTHTKLTETIRLEKDKHLDEMIKANAEKLLNKYSFSYKGLVIIPAFSTSELIHEGAKLHHCVAGYARSYAEGRKALMFIRKESNPDKPYFTVEIREGQLVQARGYKNKSYTQDKKVNEFIQAFISEVLNKNKRERKAS